jgi:hypothetical protein
MRLDRTLNQDEIREVQDAIEAWPFPEDNFCQYSYRNQAWQTAKTGDCHRPVHGEKVRARPQKEG